MAVQLGSEDPTQEFDAVVEKFNTNVHDFLLKLPGITSKNINAVMRKGGCLKNLLKMSEVGSSILFSRNFHFFLNYFLLTFYYLFPGRTH